MLVLEASSSVERTDALRATQLCPVRPRHDTQIMRIARQISPTVAGFTIR